jgi:hypothetical protein
MRRGLVRVYLGDAVLACEALTLLIASERSN